MRKFLLYRMEALRSKKIQPRDSNNGEKKAGRHQTSRFCSAVSETDRQTDRQTLNRTDGPVVANEIFEGHAPVVLDLRVVQVGVEHDGAEGHGERRVRVHERVAPGALALLVLLPRERFHQAVDALGLENMT